MMQETGLRAAITKVLRDHGAPLHYQDITSSILDQSLHTLAGVTPERTVNAYLNQMTKLGHPWYVNNIRKTTRGVFEYFDPSNSPDVLEPTDESDDGDEDGVTEADTKVRVACYGLHWDRSLVDWAKSEVLGRAYPGAVAINFADQKGIYLLHQERFTVYVGQTQDSLYNRLRHHNNGKQARWDKFSWFGFREVQEQSGELEPLSSQIDVARFTDLLEAVLIEALAPPVNSQRGKHMGTLYQQAASPSILERQRRDFHRTLAG